MFSTRRGTRFAQIDAADAAGGRQAGLNTSDTPLMQQLYNRIWLLAIAAMVFFIVVYVGWGLLDIISVPAR